MAYSHQKLFYIKIGYKFNEEISLGFSGYCEDKMYLLFEMTLQYEDEIFGKRIGDAINLHFNLGVNIQIADMLNEGMTHILRINKMFDAEIRYPTSTYNTWIKKSTLDYGRSYFGSLRYEFQTGLV